MKKSLILISTLSALSGCAFLEEPKYSCPLEGVERAKCASMEETYAASRNMDPNKKSSSVFDNKSKKDQISEQKPFFEGKQSHYPEPSNRGEPVFQQPNVYRVWVAPYVDADGNLRSGEYVYISTPGKWNYGTLKRAGSGSGIFSPVKPSELGFNPSSSNRTPMAGVLAGNQATPPTPSSGGASSQNASPSEPGLDNGSRASGGASETPPVGGITQPYVRLNNR